MTLPDKIAVSIIVPVYNVEKFLRRCLDSLVNQTLENIEIILVNDCTPDNSAVIMQEYKAKFPDKIVLINSPENRKQGGARNLGLKVAKGQYVGFVDSDDWVELDMYEKLYKKACEKNSDVAVCDYEKVWKDKSIYYKSLEIDLTGDVVHLRKSLLLRPGMVWSKIYKRSLILDNELYFPEHKSYEDIMWVGLVSLYVGSVAEIDEGLYHYMVNDNSTTQQKDKEAALERLDTMIMFWKEVHQRGLVSLYKEEIDYYFIVLYFVCSMYLCRNAFTKPRIDKLEEMRSTLLSLLPDFRKNNYYRSRTSWKVKFYVNICLISPRLYISMKNIIGCCWK